MSRTTDTVTPSARAGGAAVDVANFWFDPLCPWAWITSRWMLEVEQVRPVQTVWNVMSLAYLNLRPDRELSDDYRARMEQAWGPVRICTAAAQQAGPEVLGPLYTAIGNRFHREKRRDREALQEALAEAGLDPDLVQAADSPEYDQAIKESHHRGIDLVGEEVGTPIISYQDFACFGPVVTPIPRGEAAGKLWDGFVLVAGTPGFYELKRSRTVGPTFD